MSYQFERDFDRFDPYQGREPWNRVEVEERPEERFCDCCDTPLATDEKETCGPCAVICAEDDAYYANK